ncbi:MAG: hypothetical protein KDA24_17860 [Deltaproteobacteria bacterium]|nr:hypothetical protein [Deltaproteobacteria bacterium]
MSLAGHVKFKSFTRLMGGVVAALLVAGTFLWMNKAGERADQEAKDQLALEEQRRETEKRIEAEAEARAEREAKEREAREVAEAAANAKRAELEAQFAAMTPYGKSLMLDWKGKAIGSAKMKDVSKGRPYKINVYKDAGSSAVNRAKVDVDRDDKWDEKWTFEEAGGVTRKVAPSDDENYTVEQRWVDGAWK